MVWETYHIKQVASLFNHQLCHFVANSSMNWILWKWKIFNSYVKDHNNFQFGKKKKDHNNWSMIKSGIDRNSLTFIIDLR